MPSRATPLVLPIAGLRGEGGGGEGSGVGGWEGRDGQLVHVYKTTQTMPMNVAYPAVPSIIPSFSVIFMLPISWAMRCCVGSGTAVMIAITRDDATDIVLVQ